MGPEKNIFVFDKNGKRTEATIENAAGMILPGGGYSTLWPKGSPEQEKHEFELLKTDSDSSAAIGRANRIEPVQYEVQQGAELTPEQSK